MERSFIATKESKYSQSYDKYIINANQQRKFVFKFLQDKGIEAKSYIMRGDGFVNQPFDEYYKSGIELKIDPTTKDSISFKKMLCKPSGSYGLCAFRKNSVIGKEFAQRCIDEGIVINLDEPRLSDYFKSLEYGIYGGSVQQFEYNNNLYVKIESRCLKADDTPEGFIEIKLSEFHQRLEEYEDSIKKVS